MDYHIINNTSEKRFELIIGEKISVIEYKLLDSGISFTHTEVPPELRNKGIASALAKHLLEYAKINKLKVLPLCPFIKNYINQNPEYMPLLLQHE